MRSWNSVHGGTGEKWRPLGEEGKPDPPEGFNTPRPPDNRRTGGSSSVRHAKTRITSAVMRHGLGDLAIVDLTRSVRSTIMLDDRAGRVNFHERIFGCMTATVKENPAINADQPLRVPQTRQGRSKHGFCAIDACLVGGRSKAIRRFSAR